ncbi:PfkB family carbohydrate kinase [Jatrophihabitans sp. YIM 134969]
MTGGRVVVVGSANVDLVLRVDHVVAPGETLLAAGSARGAGGKGANQAVAAARAGADVAFIGAVGNDPDGGLSRDALDAAGVDTTRLRAVDAPTGLAVVSVAVDGENAIVVVPGANHTLDELGDGDRDLLATAAVALFQLEIPLPFVTAAARLVDGLVVLNAAPATALPDDLVDAVDVLVVNEGEAAVLGEAVLGRVPAVVTTLGAEGCVLQLRGEPGLRVAAERVEVVDTTGAGDAFCGALAAALADGREWPDVLHHATTAAARAVASAGAQG